mmetsp:Transcript_5938/g.24532  ORF Transcript_5938/g.24532 Transcript_5938/m.24532 type:complete len:230 (+) Transcript_5938:364-1053(+)
MARRGGRWTPGERRVPAVRAVGHAGRRRHRRDVGRGRRGRVARRRRVAPRRGPRGLCANRRRRAADVRRARGMRRRGCARGAGPRRRRRETARAARRGRRATTRVRRARVRAAAEGWAPRRGGRVERLAPHPGTRGGRAGVRAREGRNGGPSLRAGARTAAAEAAQDRRRHGPGFRVKHSRRDGGKKDSWRRRAEARPVRPPRRAAAAAAALDPRPRHEVHRRRVPGVR